MPVKDTSKTPLNLKAEAKKFGKEIVHAVALGVISGTIVYFAKKAVIKGIETVI